MTSFDGLFSQIDEALKDKKPNELMLYYALVFIVVGYVAYAYAMPVTEKMLKRTQRDLVETNKKLNTEKTYLASKTRNGDQLYYVKKLKKDIVRLENNLEKSVYTNGYVDNKLKDLSYLLYNDENWANFIDKVAFLAKQYKINIKSIKSTFTETDFQKVEKSLEIEIDSNGDFNDIMLFVNSIEESELVVDIYNMQFVGETGVNANFKIAVWGLKY